MDEWKDDGCRRGCCGKRMKWKGAAVADEFWRSVVEWEGYGRTMLWNEKDVEEERCGMDVES